MPIIGGGPVSGPTVGADCLQIGAVRSRGKVVLRATVAAVESAADLVNVVADPVLFAQLLAFVEGAAELVGESGWVEASDLGECGL